MNSDYNLTKFHEAFDTMVISLKSLLSKQVYSLFHPHSVKSKNGQDLFSLDDQLN